jgi:hypothetical protein
MSLLVGRAAVAVLIPTAALAVAAPAGAAVAGPAAFTVAGGPSGAVTLPPGSPTVLTFTVTDTGPDREAITVQVTGLYFDGDTAQFTGSPSPGLDATAAPARLDLAPGASQDVKVTLTAAPGARPGGLYAGVVFSNVPPSQSGRVNVVTAQGRPLIGHVPGPVADSGRITSFRQLAPPAGGSALTLQASFLDTGNVDYEVGGTVTVLGPTGALGTVPVGTRLVLPGNPRTFPINFSPPAGAVWPAGPMTAQLHLVWGVSAEHSGDAQTSVQIAPPSTAQAAPPSAGQASLPPTFVGRPLTPVPHHGVSSRSGTSASIWALRFLDLLMLLVALALLLIALWSRRRREDDEDRRPPGRLATSD